MDCWSVQYKASVTVPDSTSPERYEPPYILRFENFVLFITLAMGISHPSSLIISLYDPAKMVNVPGFENLSQI